MSNLKTNWTREELNAFILLYSANADFQASKVEIDRIKSKISSASFEKIMSDFERDNDYQILQKIQSSVQAHGYMKDELNLLFEEIKALFLSDGKFDQQEKNLLIGLKTLLK